ncbi:MAG: phage tail protein [Achromobacter xylosoxidans]|nr:phage tail protein [Achromobacter xylosoxidans]
MGQPNAAARKTITSFREPGIPPRPARIRRRAFFCAAPLLRFVIKVPFMQLLKPINVGQAPNDQTGDTLRDAMGLVNENFAKTRAGVEAVEVATAAAQRKADAAIASAEKGAAGGVTPLDAAGKVPAAHLPPPAIPLSQKSAPGGVAPLDEDGRVPVDHLPVPVASVPQAEKGVPGGVATLGANGKITPAQLPALIPSAEKAQPNGVATLAEDGMIVGNQLPPLVPAMEKGRPGGVATLGADGRVPAVQLPAVLDAVPLADKGRAGGVASLDEGGKVPVSQLPPIPNGPPVGSVGWWPLRTSIPAGQIPADGQTLARALFPDLTAMVTGGKLPVVPEADWLADPLKRGSYTVGDGTGTIRVPDLNGQAPNSVCAVFLRGDGLLSAGLNGLLQRDAMQPISGAQNVAYGVVTGAGAGVFGGSRPLDGLARSNPGYEFTNNSDTIRFDNALVARTAPENRPTNVSGAWTIHAFSAVTDSGSLDIAQLASDHAALNAAFQALRSQVLGVGQTLQDVGASRAFGTTYTNTTGRPISVYIVGSATTSAGGNMYLMVGGIIGTRAIATQNGVTLALTALIPPGATYRVVADSMTQNFWTEYR